MEDHRIVTSPEPRLAPARPSLRGSSGKAPGPDRLLRELAPLGQVLGFTAGRPAQVEVGSAAPMQSTQTSALPYRLICMLAIDFPDHRSYGTGWLAGERLVMTAGHNLYSTAKGGWAREIRVYPGRSDDQTPFGRFASSRFASVEGWTANADPDLDYGAIVLGEAVGDQLGWFSVGATTDSEIRGSRVKLCGYAQDLGSGSQQWIQTGRVVDLTTSRVMYSLSTYSGDSGAPVWEDPSDSQIPHVVALHARGGDDAGASSSGTRVAGAMLDNIRQWREL